MDKLKRYIDCYIATETCNLRCSYCYITQKRRFNKQLVKFKHSPEVIRHSLSQDRLGGTCLLNLCAGGETLLVEEVIDVAKALLEEGHYVMIVTNGTLSRRFDEIAKLPADLLNRLIFKFSFHYLEFLRIGKMDVFFENVLKMKNAGASFTVELTPSDELIPHIPEMKNVCMEKLGALCHVTIARDDRTKGIEVLSEHSFEEYKKIWGEFQSELFDFKTNIFYKKRKEFCYAGDWSLYLNLSTGRLAQCYIGRELDNIYEDIERPLKLEAIGHCTLPHCYNGHSFLTLGTIPELEAPTYAQMRDRTNCNGEAWLQPEVRSFFDQKLGDNHELYAAGRKRQILLKQPFHRLASIGRRAIRKMKRNK